MLWRKSSKRPTKASDLTAFIDEGSEIEGKYSFSGTVMINGRFRGEIVSSDSLIIGEVVGNVCASERVELRGTARVCGDVEAPIVVVEEGVLFDGHCKMTKARSADDASATRDTTVVSLKRS